MFFLFLLSSFSLWYSHYAYAILFLVVFGYSVQFNSVFVLFTFQFCSLLKLLRHTQAHNFCPQACPIHYSNQPIRTILHFCYSVFSLLHSFCFFLKISVFLFTLPICSCMLPALSLGNFSLLIIVILNSWSDHYNISTMSASDSCFVSSNCAFCYEFFLITGHEALGKSKYSK